jgi:hypothetical protein
VPCAPEIAIDYRCVDIAWLYNIMVSIEIGVSYDLHIGMIITVSTHFDRRNILIKIGPKNRLYDNEMDMVSCNFNQTQIVNITIMVEIEIGNLPIGIIDP